MSNSIIDELLQHSMDTEISVSQLVKYCSILADNINDVEMSSWCDAELYGHDELPEYRKVYGQVAALDYYEHSSTVAFANSEMADTCSIVWIKQPIGDLEEMVKNVKPGSYYRYMFPTELAQNLMAENPKIISMFWKVQPQAHSKIIQHVRSHVFKWAKELKRKGVIPTGSFPKLGAKGVESREAKTIINASTVNTAALGSGNIFTQSPVQVAAINSTQNIEFKIVDLTEIKTKLDVLLKYLSDKEASTENNHLIEEINTFSELISKPAPRFAWISETLSSIRGVLENATGSAIANYADKTHLINSIAKLLGLG